MKTKITNVAKDRRRLYDKGKMVLLQPGESHVADSSVAESVKEHYAFKVEEVSDDYVPKKSKKKGDQ